MEVWSFLTISFPPQVFEKKYALVPSRSFASACSTSWTACPETGGRRYRNWFLVLLFARLLDLELLFFPGGLPGPRLRRPLLLHARRGLAAHAAHGLRRRR